MSEARREAMDTQKEAERMVLPLTVLVRAFLAVGAT